MTERQYAVAIDGPSGAGKSTLARAAAEALHILYVDTGAIYRTIGVYMYRHDIAPTDAPAVIAALPEITVALRYDEEGLQRMYLNGEDVTKEIRLPMISKYASDVSAIPEVRAFLMELQRSLAREHSVIMDGRDIGTVVLPDAEVKVFLCADVETRARRRFLELEQRGTPKPFDEVLRDMEQRDYNDTHRAAAPLRPADDAIMIDNTDMDFAASLELLLDVIRGACGIVRNKFYAAAWRVLRPLVLFFLPVDLRGTEHLEGGEPVLLCANHSSAWDPILFVLSMPQRFNVRIMAKKQLFSIPIVGGFLRAIGVFPVDRGNSDIGAVKTAIQSLRDGWNLFLFPEGTRVKTPGQADVKSGAGMMAIRAGVKLAPVYIGTKKRIFRKTPIIIGEPFEPEYTGRKGTAEEYTANAHEVMRRAYALGGIECR